MDARLSADEGATWSAPLRLVSYVDADSGYPSSAQLPDGTVVTAYYHGLKAGDPSYHMGVAIWDPKQV